MSVAQRHFTVDEFYRMAEVGILTPEDRVELLEGRIIVMSPIGRRHAACVDRMNRLLHRLVGEAAIIRVQSPVRLDESSEPEPDIALLKPRAGFYEAGHPAPADVLLIIEVAETSLEYDRNEKLPVYAQAAIPEVWLVDLTTRVVHAFHDPMAETYQQVSQAGPGHELTLQCLNHLTIPVDSILG